MWAVQGGCGPREVAAHFPVPLSSAPTSARKEEACCPLFPLFRGLIRKCTHAEKCNAIWHHKPASQSRSSILNSCLNSIHPPRKKTPQPPTFLQLSVYYLFIVFSFKFILIIVQSSIVCFRHFYKWNCTACIGEYWVSLAQH